ncbi:Protein of unknown function [Jatrophihabitans endophyticus]|uniref:Glycosyltransferase 61 catalytic domain-containing protein n=1 Tax=Jatrophihabitans endophyticus TaxID=1206085 RepID=A0A1M5U689_9ACTN|nr:glycosyltransferase family 61 protein [Jatrophihabitans endophyticus]SHH58411.1 Protein of unknown function [Jatrophihabitans endophyticus]
MTRFDHSARSIRRFRDRADVTARLRAAARAARHPARLAPAPVPLPAAEPDSPTISPLAALRTPIDPPREGLVVIIAPTGRTAAELAPWLSDFERSRCHVFAAAPGDDVATVATHVHTVPDTVDTAAIHETLKTLPRVGVILDLVGDDPAARWRRLFLHLRAKGHYVIGRLDDQPLAPDVRAWAATLVAFRDNGTAAPQSVAGEFALAIEDVTVTPTVLTIGKRGTHLLKLRGHETDAVLPVRDPDVTVDSLVVRPAGSFEGRDTVVHHRTDAELVWPDRTIAYPPLHLRHYAGRVLFASHMLFATQRSVLPDSYRWHLYANPSNPRFGSPTSDFARLTPDVKAKGTLEGTYYNLDPQFSGFGHVMTEVVGRLWGWDQAKREFPGIKALFGVKSANNARNTAKYRVLRAYGIPEEDIVWASKPKRVNSLVSATSMWHNNLPYSVHPDLPEVWDRLAANLVDPAVETYDKVFVSRSGQFARRSCHNIAQVEELFARHGFTIYYPEHFDLTEQASVFASARVLAGLGGSGLFNILFAKQLETAIILNQDAYYHRNEHLFTSLLGGEVHYFWSPTDPPPAEGWTRQRASEASWTFDLERHEEPLVELLRSVGTPARR